MYCEWPELRRCCFCFPLRRGILTLAYLNIVLAVTQVVAAGFFGYALPYNRSYFDLPPYHHINKFFVVLDLLVTGILLVGLHAKRERFVRVYYYFTIGTLSALVLLTAIDISISKHAEEMVYTAVYFAFASVGNACMLVLIHSMLKKMQTSKTNDDQLVDIKEDLNANGQTYTVPITYNK